MNRWLAVASVVGLVVGCGPQSVRLDGVAQKGPLILGSQVTVSGLDSSMSPTGTAFSTQTTDALGNFGVSIALATSAMEVHASGYYMDEATGDVSAEPIDLHGVVNTGLPSLRINLLTTLQAPLLKLSAVGGGPTALATATSSSASKVLAAVGVDPAAVQGFSGLSNMRIDGQGDQDAVLLAMSAILSEASHDYASQNGTSPGAALSFLVDRFAQDLANNSVAADSVLQAAWKQGASDVAVGGGVRYNVQQYYAGQGVTMTPPAFEEWVDKDGSGILPRRMGVTPTIPVPPPVTDALPGTTYTSAPVMVNGLDAGINAFASFSSSAINPYYLYLKNGATVRNGVTIPGSFTSATNGDVLQISFVAGPFGTSQFGTISVGTARVSWVVTSKKVPLLVADNNESSSSWGPLSQYGGDRYSYYAAPFVVTSTVSPEYVATGLPIAADGGCQSSTGVWTDDGGAPGVALLTSTQTGPFLSGYSIVRPDGGAPAYNDNSDPCLAHFQPGLLVLDAGTPYWVVYQFSSQQQPSRQSLAGYTGAPFSTVQFSNDGATWISLSVEVGGGTQLAPFIYLEQ